MRLLARRENEGSDHYAVGITSKICCVSIPEP